MKAEVLVEAQELRARGFRHVLLVSGEHARIVSKGYLEECVAAVAPLFAQVSVEVQVWDTDTYRRLVAAGCDGVVVYQEVYDLVCGTLKPYGRGWDDPADDDLIRKDR